MVLPAVAAGGNGRTVANSPIDERHLACYFLRRYGFMDTLTHALSGALLARATEPKKLRPGQLPRRWRMSAGFAAAAFPDVDFVAGFIDPLAHLAWHRGVTHSIIMLPLWAVILSILLSLISRRRYSWKAFVGVCMLGLGIHIAGDVITAYGTMILAPLSMRRIQLPTTFIIDPYFTAIIVAGLIASAIWKKTRTAAVLGLAFLGGYVGFQAILYGHAVAFGNGYIAAHDLDSARAYAIPQPLSPFNWMVVVRQPDRYHQSHISLLRAEPPSEPAPDASLFGRLRAVYRPLHEARWRQMPRYGASEADVILAQEAWSAAVLRRFRDFAMFPAVYRIDRGPGRQCVWFYDLRFDIPGRSMPFRYGVCREHAAAPWSVYRFAG